MTVKRETVKKSPSPDPPRAAPTDQLDGQAYGAPAGMPTFLLGDARLQAKLAGGSQDDPAELEADRTAQSVAPGGSRPPSRPQGGGLSRASSRPGSDGGQPLPVPARQFFERRLAADLSGVRIHTSDSADASARHLNALAFTHGSDIAFRHGCYSPGTQQGNHLLAHELAHVIQQRRDTRPRIQPQTADTELPTSSGTDTATLFQHSAGDWVVVHGPQLVRELRERLADAPLSLPIPEMHWQTGSVDFIRALLAPLGPGGASIWYQLPALLKPDSLIDAVNIGRDCFPRRVGSITWKPGVVDEVARRVSFRLLESLPRVAPRAARHKVRDWRPSVVTLPAPAAQPVQPDNSPQLISPGFALFYQPQSIPGGLAFSNPIDPYVYAALRATTTVEAQAYRANHPEEFTPAVAVADELPLRPVQFRFLASEGIPSWIRVTSPIDATREEVANTLYGDPNAAYRLMAAPPLFGLPSADLAFEPPTPTDLLNRQGPQPFSSEPAEMRPVLLPVHLAALADAYRQAGITIGNAVQYGTANDILLSPKGDDAARLAAARILPTRGANKDLIRERLGLIHNNLADMQRPAGQLARPPDAPSMAFVTYMDEGKITRMAWEPYEPPESTAARGRLELARSRVETRFRHVSEGTDADALLWDGQTRGQLEIVTEAHRALNIALDLAGRYRGWPSIYSLIRSIAEGYVSAAEISDLYPAARERLDQAEQRSVLFPATAMELWLAQIREVLDSTRTSKITLDSAKDPGKLYEINDMDRMERGLRERLTKVRAQLLQNPDAARATMEAIFNDLQDLQTGASLAIDLDTVDQIWQALYDSMSVMGALRSLWGGGNALLEEAMDGANKLNSEWYDILMEWRFGDRKVARENLKKKAASKEWRTWVGDMQAVIRDHQQWDALMTFVAMVGIAVLSGGIGAWAEAGAGAAWGVGAGASGWVELGAAGVGVVTEAGVFTALSYPITAKDPSVGDAASQFGENVMFFGAGRVLSAGFKGLLGEARAATTTGKFVTAVGVGAAFTGANLLMANAQAQNARGRGLTSGEAEHIGLENVAFMTATTLASALLHRPLTNLRIQGELTGLNFRYERALSSLEVTMTELGATKEPGEPLRRRLIAQTQNAVLAEQSLTDRLQSIVKTADGLVDPDKPNSSRARDKYLQRFGISDEFAAQLRSGAISKQTIAGLRVMQGVRITRALEAAGSDFLIRSDLYQEALEYFRSLPDTSVLDSRTSVIIFDPPVPHFEVGGDSFLVQPANEAAFRVYKRVPGSLGEVAAHADVAPAGEKPAAAGDPMARPAQPGGGRAGASELDWGLPTESIEGVRRALLQRGDIGSVHQSMRDAGVPASREQIQAVKRYLFDSQGIAFDRTNHEAWQRLADGRGQVRDIAFLVHELGEIGALEDIRRRTGFDYRGLDYEHMSATERRNWQADFNRYYLESHSKALEAEYDYVAAAVEQATGGRKRIGRNIAAAVDPTRDEARRYMQVDGVPLNENKNFETWRARAGESVEIGRGSQERLNLPSDPTLAELVEAVKHSPGGPEAASRGASWSYRIVPGTATGRRGISGASAGDMRSLTVVERARHDRVADYLEDHGLDWGDLFNSEEEVHTFFDRFPTTADALKALETRARRVVDLRGSSAQSRLAGGSESGGSRLSPFDEPPSATQIRAAANGEATGGTGLRPVTGPLFDYKYGRVAPIPGQIAQRMRGMTFRSWRDFRETFWRMMYQDPVIRADMTPDNQDRIALGYAPFVPTEQRVGRGSNAKLQLNHRRPIEQGGGVFDLDNIEIVTPLAHQGLGDQ